MTRSTLPPHKCGANYCDDTPGDIHREAFIETVPTEILTDQLALIAYFAEMFAERRDELIRLHPVAGKYKVGTEWLVEFRRMDETQQPAA